MDRYRNQHWRGRGRGAPGPAGRGRPAIEQGGGNQRAQAVDTAEGGVPVHHGQNPTRHGHVSSVGSVGSWDGDRDFLPPAARQGGARQETSRPVPPAQHPVQQGLFTAAQVETLCERYAANEKERLQQIIKQKDLNFAHLQGRLVELEQKDQMAQQTIAERDAEILRMSQLIFRLQQRIPAGGQQAALQHPRAPVQNVAPVPYAYLPAANYYNQGMQQRGHQYNVGAQTFQPRRQALPAPAPPHQIRPRDLMVVAGPSRRPLPPQGPSPPGVPTPQRLLANTPAHRDDVFDPSFPDRMPWRNAEFDQEPTYKLLDAAFAKVKNLVSIQKQQHRIQDPRSAKEKAFFNLCANHIEDSKMAAEMLQDQQRYIRLVSGVINSLLVDKIFTQTMLLSYPEDKNGSLQAFADAYQAEKEVTYPHEKVNDYEYRFKIAENRANAAKNVVRIPGFWHWSKDKARAIAEEILPDVDPIVTIGPGKFVDELTKATTELLRLHVRMVQEVKMHKLEFVGRGRAWTVERMINRDPALQAIDPDDKSTGAWVTQCCITPVVMEISFEKTPPDNRVFVKSETLLKAEVTLCARKGNLKA